MPGGNFTRVLLLAGGLAACDAPTEPAVPSVVGVEVARAGPLVRVFSVELERPAPIRVRYGGADGPVLEVMSGDARRSHTVTLARLRPDRLYDFQITGTRVRGSFATEPLPPDLAALELSATGTLSIPLVLLHVFNEEGFRGWVIVDEEGSVVWYRRSVGFSFAMTRRANGDFVFMDGDLGLEVVTVAGEVVRRLRQDELGHEPHHDILEAPGGSVLFLAFDDRTEDERLTRGEAIWDWAPETGRVEKRWSSWDHMDPAVDRGPRFGQEWLHANSLRLGPRGNAVVSFHYLNQVVSIEPGFGGFEWRLGGVNATIPVSGEDRFTGQHTAEEIEPDRLLLFDNGLEQGRPSRAVELDISAGTAVEVWAWTPPSANHASFVSSARRLPDGNTLVGFGLSAGVAGASGPVEVYEVTPEGEVAWHLETDGIRIAYRAEPMGSLAGEVEVAHRVHGVVRR